MPSLILASEENSTHVEELVPWHVNGTLPADEQQRVERHLATCADCRASVDLEARIHSLMNGRHETVDCAPQSGWRKLTSQLDASGTQAERTAATPAPLRNGLSRVAAWHRLPAMLLAEAAAIGVLGFAFFHRDSDPALYRTLTEPSSAAAVNNLTLRVVLTEGTSPTRVREMLDHVGGAIHSGPSSGGLYTIELPRPPTVVTTQPDDTLAWLRAQPEVRFAEWVGTPPDQDLLTGP